MGGVYLRQYNVALDDSTAGSRKVRVSLRKAGSGTFATGSDWTPAAGDVKVSKDGGTEANIGTLPSYGGGSWGFILSATELSAGSIHIRISNTALDDEDFAVETYGNASAMYPGNYVDGTNNGVGTRLDAAISSRSTLDAAGVWSYATRILTAGTNIALAKGTGLTGLNDIAATAIVSGGAISTSGGSVNSVATVTGGVNVTKIDGQNVTATSAVNFDNFLTDGDMPDNFKSLVIDGDGFVTFNNTSIATVTTLTNLPSAPTDWLTAAAVKADAVTKIQSGLSTLNAAGVWSILTSGLTTSGSIGELLAKLLFDGSGNVKSTPQTDVTLAASQHVIVDSGTVTNLTNAPTAGDFTAAMKTSLSAATPTVTLAATQSLYAPAKAGDAMALTSSERTTLAGVFWSVLTSAITTAGSIGLALKTLAADFANMITGSGGYTPMYTTTALSNGPSGGSGSGLSGPSSVTLTFVDADTNPVPLAEFTLLSSDKSSVIGPGRADSNGVATFGTNDGDYYVTTQATSTVLFADAALTVSGTTTQTITGSSNVPAASADPGACTIYDTTREHDDTIKDGVVYTIKITGGPAGTQNGREFTATSSGTSANNLSFDLPRGVQFVFKRGSSQNWSPVFTVPDAGSVQLSALTTDGAVIGKDAS